MNDSQSIPVQKTPETPIQPPSILSFQFPKFNPLLIISGVLIFLSGLTISLFLYKNLSSPKTNPLPVSLTNILFPISPSPSPIFDPTITQKIYVNNQYGFSISFPSDFEINQQADNQSYIIEKILNKPGKNSNFLYITIIPNGQNMIKNNIYAYDPKETNILLGMQIGESKFIRPKDLLSKFWTYRRLQDVSIDGLQAQSFENNNPWEFPPGTVERKMYLSKGNMMYIIGFLYGRDLSENFFDQILSTFKFLNTNTSSSNQLQGKLANGKTYLLPYPSSCTVTDEKTFIIVDQKLKCKIDGNSILLLIKTGGHGYDNLIATSTVQLENNLWSKEIFSIGSSIHTTYSINLDQFYSFGIEIIFDQYNQQAEKVAEQIISGFQLH